MFFSPESVLPVPSIAPFRYPPDIAHAVIIPQLAVLVMPSRVSGLQPETGFYNPCRSSEQERLLGSSDDLLPLNEKIHITESPAGFAFIGSAQGLGCILDHRYPIAIR